MDWGRAAWVEKPSNFQEKVAPSYVGVHPILRFAGQAMDSYLPTVWLTPSR